MNKQSIQAFLQDGQAILGIELGSTRIKAQLLGPRHQVLATGSFDWQNQLVDGVWTYDLDEVWRGLAAAYLDLKQQIQAQYGLTLRRLKALGISAMMHGYLAFGQDGQLLVPFRTWRNTSTGQAAAALSEAFDFAIPQRWSVAHLYQAILNGEPHVKKLYQLNTLAGTVHHCLTGQRVLGVGDASGMFPIDVSTHSYHQGMLTAFERLAGRSLNGRNLQDLFPRVLQAGADAGQLSPDGAQLLDPSGDLLPGCACCPPEGDAGTGMVATNSVLPGTGNLSAGTSIFAMLTLEKPLLAPHPQIDLITTPAGDPVAMVHCNNCTSDLNAWVRVFGQFTQAAGLELSTDRIYQCFFEEALTGQKDGGGLTSIGYHSGEHITGFENGQPLLLYPSGEGFCFANLARSILMSSLATLRMGLDILRQEGVPIRKVVGHGGLYKTGEAGQRLSAAALQAPVSVLETASEGGAFGIALLAAYRVHKQPGESLGDYLQQRVFASLPQKLLEPDLQDVAGFENYVKSFAKALSVERTAVEVGRS